MYSFVYLIRANFPCFVYILYYIIFILQQKDVCPPSWEEDPQYQGMESYFGGSPPLSKAVGYLVVIGFGALFSLFTTCIVFLDKKFSDNATITSEQFK